MEIDEGKLQDFNEIISCSDNHNFSLVVLKDERGRYLLKWDNRWKTYLFPYSRTKENDKEAVFDFVRTSIGYKPLKILKTESGDFTKYSVSANMTKKYHHIFYNIAFESLSQSQKSAFKYNGVKYKWLSIDELKADKNIMAKNSETVKFVEEKF